MNDETQATATTLFEEGVRLFEAREFAAAIAPLDAALKLDPNYIDAWCCRALVFGHLKRYAKSIEDFNRALALNPKDHTALYNRSLVLAEWNKHKEALESYDQLLLL